MLELVPLDSIDPPLIETLLDRAFGADRRLRTAYRIREGVAPVAALSFAALDGALVGTIQCWPVALSHDGGGETPMVMVGPVAVAPDRQRDGIGRLLMASSLAAAQAQGFDQAMMLIGDPDFYARFFGFTADHTGLWRLPGPVERHRLLARGAAIPGVAGVIRPRATALA